MQNYTYGQDERGRQYRIDDATGLRQYPGMKPGMVPRARKSLHIGSAVFTARFEVKLADLWIGAFWRRGEYDYLPQLQRYDLWICIVPCLPLHISWSRREVRDRSD